MVDTAETLVRNDEAVDVVDEPNPDDDGGSSGKKRKEGVVNEEESKLEPDGEPARKKRKYCHLDLKIIVKGTDESGKTPVEKVFHKNAHQLAQFSDFFDAAMSSNMQEQNTRIVTLNDTTPPELFETALEYLECAKKARAATPKDMLKVVTVYDKYQFSGGLELCDAVLLEYIQEEAKKPFPEDIDFLVEVVTSTARFSLQESKKAGVEYLEGRFVSQHAAMGVLMFTAQHLTTLQPLFQQSCFTQAALPPPMRHDPAVLENPKFGDLFILHKRSVLCEKMPFSLVTSKGLDFGYFFAGYCSNRGKNGYSNWTKGAGVPGLFIYKSNSRDGDWAVIDENNLLIWVATGSAKLRYPPERHWVVMDGRYGDAQLICTGAIPFLPTLSGNNAAPTNAA